MLGGLLLWSGRAGTREGGDMPRFRILHGKCAGKVGRAGPIKFPATLNQFPTSEAHTEQSRNGVGTSTVCCILWGAKDKYSYVVKVCS